MSQTQWVSGHFSSTPTHSYLRPLPHQGDSHPYPDTDTAPAALLKPCPCHLSLAVLNSLRRPICPSVSQQAQELELPINLRASHRGDVYTYSVSDLSTEMICQEVSELPNDSPQKVESRPPFECNRATFLQAAPKGLSFCLCPSWPSSQPSIKVSSEMTGSALKGTH